jgi:hypothetical protein
MVEGTSMLMIASIGTVQTDGGEGSTGLDSGKPKSLPAALASSVVTAHSTVHESKRSDFYGGGTLKLLSRLDKCINDVLNYLDNKGYSVDNVSFVHCFIFMLFTPCIFL